MDGEKESHLRFTFFMINMEMGDVIEFVDLLVLLKIGDKIQWIGTSKLYVISLSSFWRVL